MREGKIKKLKHYKRIKQSEIDAIDQEILSELQSEGKFKKVGRGKKAKVIYLADQQERKKHRLMWLIVLLITGVMVVFWLMNIFKAVDKPINDHADDNNKLDQATKELKSTMDKIKTDLSDMEKKYKETNIEVAPINGENNKITTPPIKGVAPINSGVPTNVLPNSDNKRN